jgi:hypothetical protein
MKLNYPKIKKFLQIGLFAIDLVIFILVISSTNSKSKNYKEYTGSSKFFLDIYIIVIYLVLILVTVYPKLLYYRIKKYILIIFTDKGKVIISFLISLIYWFARNKPQFVLGIILTISSILLLIYEFIFYFTKVEDFLTSKGIEFSNKRQPTFDIDSMDKNEINTTPISNQNDGYNNSKEGKDNSGYDNNNTSEDNNQKNPSIEHRDVEISSGFDNSGSNNPNAGQNGFGF